MVQTIYRKDPIHVLFFAFHHVFHFLSSTSTPRWSWGFQDFWQYWVSTPLTITLANIWLTKSLDSSRPATGSIQSEPSRTESSQNGPLNIPLVFFCKNCGLTLGPALPFGRTLRFQKCINEVVCFCCGKKRQSGRFVSISNYLTLWHLLRDRFMKSWWTPSWMLVTCTITFWTLKGYIAQG